MARNCADVYLGLLRAERRGHRHEVLFQELGELFFRFPDFVHHEAALDCLHPVEQDAWRRVLPSEKPICLHALW